MNKWQSTLVESCKQSGCPILPKMNTPVSLNQFFQSMSLTGSKMLLEFVASLESGADLLLNGLEGVYKRQKKIIYAVGQREIFQKVSMKVLKA